MRPKELKVEINIKDTALKIFLIKKDEKIGK